ncbi:WD40 repeat domain-containing protein [Agarilytica rhodophyticola]|uniref:WD40 repeat domain-containing protein n=1 Tax=Agarilytica rhodophyticola TaxID=1737490 RepID=UPI000B343ABC|nr:hypothetical protein [Agarilytica rhodophyticola]
MWNALIFIFIIFFLTSCDKAGKPTASLEVAAKGIHGAALSDDSQFAVVGSIHHGGSYWHIPPEERLFNWNHKQNETTTIIVADISHRGNWALTANPFNLVLWNTKSGEGERFWSAPGEILDAELGPNAVFALLGLSDHSAVIFDIRRGGIQHTFVHTNRVRTVDLSRDGRLALTGSEDFTANLWDVKSGKKLTTIKHRDDVQLVKLSPDGSLALSVSKYDQALIWETATTEVVGDIALNAEKLKRGLTFISARFNEDNTRLLTGRSDRTVELWDITSMSKLARWKLPKRSAWKPTSAAVIDVGFGQENTYFAIASNGFIHKLK